MTYHQLMHIARCGVSFAYKNHSSNMHGATHKQKQNTQKLLIREVIKQQLMGSNINCEQMNDENEACLSALQLCCGPMVYTAVLNAALELNLFEIISKATPPGVPASVVASQLMNIPTTQQQHPELPRRLDRMLSLLASHSLLTCSAPPKEDGTPGTERLYLLSLAGKYFVDDHDDKNKGSVALISRFLSHRAFVDALM